VGVVADLEKLQAAETTWDKPTGALQIEGCQAYIFRRPRGSGAILL